MGASEARFLQLKEHDNPKGAINATSDLRLAMGRARAGQLKSTAAHSNYKLNNNHSVCSLAMNQLAKQMPWEPIENMPFSLEFDYITFNFTKSLSNFECSFKILSSWLNNSFHALIYGEMQTDCNCHTVDISDIYLWVHGDIQIVSNMFWLVIWWAHVWQMVTVLFSFIYLIWHVLPRHSSR